VPKPPPTWSATQRILFSGMPKTKAVISRRMMCGSCELIQTVYSPVAGSYWAAAPRGSMGVGIRRWLTRRSLTTTSASSSASAVACSSPHDQSIAMLPGAFSCSWSAPSSAARSASTTTSRGSQSTSISSSASSAAYLLSATTAATPAPVKVTPVDLERSRRVDEVLDAARLPGTRERRQVLEVLPGEDGDHARVGGGLRRVDARDPGVRVRRAQDRHVGHSG
jgi:hypothetical protein